MKKAIEVFVTVVILLLIPTFCYWALAPGPMNISNDAVELEMEKWLGFDMPSEFELVKAWDGGYSGGDLHYTYEIQFSQDEFVKFQSLWDLKNEKLEWIGGDRKTALLISITVPPDTRRVFYSYSKD